MCSHILTADLAAALKEVKAEHDKMLVEVAQVRDKAASRERAVRSKKLKAEVAELLKAYEASLLRSSCTPGVVQDAPPPPSSLEIPDSTGQLYDDDGVARSQRFGEYLQEMLYSGALGVPPCGMLPATASARLCGRFLELRAPLSPEVLDVLFCSTVHACLTTPPAAW